MVDLSPYITFCIMAFRTSLFSSASVFSSAFRASFTFFKAFVSDFMWRRKLPTICMTASKFLSTPVTFIVTEELLLSKVMSAP